MNVKGKLASWTATGKRAERRRVVNLAARLNERDAKSVDVRAVDVSSVGCMVTPAGPSKVGDIVWLKLSGLEPLRCRSSGSTPTRPAAGSNASSTRARSSGGRRGKMQTRARGHLVRPPDNGDGPLTPRNP